jgi:putative flippase GtrA
MDWIKQAVKYGIVGVGNTLLSLVIIWIMTKKFGCTEASSNFVGYFIGLINSFFLNRRWTFNSTANVVGSGVRFFLVFAVCYLLQLGVLLCLNRYSSHNPPLYLFFEPVLKVLKIDALFYIQILSMIVYTVLNFLINKYYTFKK